MVALSVFLFFCGCDNPKDELVAVGATVRLPETQLPIQLAFMLPESLNNNQMVSALITTVLQAIKTCPMQSEFAPIHMQIIDGHVERAQTEDLKSECLAGALEGKEIPGIKDATIILQLNPPESANVLAKP